MEPVADSSGTLARRSCQSPRASALASLARSRWRLIIAVVVCPVRSAVHASERPLALAMVMTEPRERSPGQPG